MVSTWTINHRRAINKRIKIIREKMKPVKCPICNNRLGKTCNSHSIPQMILKTIETDGHFYNKNVVDNMRFFDKETGLNNTGTFHYICNSCDNSYFADYEKSEAIHAVPSNLFLVEIAIKNILQKMQQKAFERAFFKYDQVIIQSKVVADREEAIKVFELDYRDYNECLDKLKKDKQGNAANFKIIYRKVLPYITPIAAQECFTIYKDRLGNLINDPNLEEAEKIQVVHLCIFPYDGCTTVLLFYDSCDTSYDVLLEQFSQSTDEENLKHINYYMLAFGENYFYSEKIQKDVLRNDSLKKVSQEYIGERGNFGIMAPEERKEYSPIKYDEIPFILGQEFSL